MKTICCFFSALFLSISLSSAYANTNFVTQNYYNQQRSSQVVVFRTTQRLKSRDGRQIYLRPNRVCELWDGDRLEVSTTYKLMDGEVRLLDERGNTVYKGSYVLSRDRQNIASLTIAGTTYYKM